ncbi:MAG: hypothetical protein HY094_09715 [Candidatus Melainabacteria bacterium]|nr:hypothetical protein [Candidatus Melainabacteria bacterium]
MGRAFCRSLLLIGLASWFLSLNSLNNSALAECDSTGKSIGAECHFEDCECASAICINGTCVECSEDTDCQDSNHCVENKCQ